MPLQAFTYAPCGDLIATHTYTNGTDTITESYAYDMFGNRIATTDALGNAVYKSYDPFGRVVAEWGATYPVRHAYDTQGRRTSLATTRDGATWDETAWTYDPRTGLCMSKTYADGSTVTYTYTPDNLLLRTTYNDGTWRENIYDNSRRVVGEQSNDGSLDSAREYNLFGQMVMETNASAMATYARSATGNATNIVQGVDSVTDVRDVQYDPHSRRTAFGATACGYAHDGKLASVSNGHAFVEYLYDGDRQDAGHTLTLSNGTVFCRSVSRHPYLRSLATNIVNSVNGIAIDSLFYTYDALNRPISRNADAFAYNIRSEVTNAIFHSPFSIFHSYGYDNIGNSTNHESNCLNQYAQFTYDARGNMTQCGEWTYAYDSGNRLVSVTSNGLPVASFAYDAQGRRVKKVAADGTRRYFYDGWLPIREHLTRPDNTVSETQYCWGTDLSGTMQGAGGVGGLLHLERDGAIYVPTYDNNGNVIHYCDAQGNVVASFIYDAFGNIISQSGPMADDFAFRFSTKYYDHETGLYYYGCRYYHPPLMRWINRDPIEEDGGENLYAFCGNNGINRLDSLGEDWHVTRRHLPFAEAKRDNVYKDTIYKLSQEIDLDPMEAMRWARKDMSGSRFSNRIAIIRDPKKYFSYDLIADYFGDYGYAVHAVTNDGRQAFLCVKPQ